MMNKSTIPYLRIIGKLYPDNKLELRPSYLIDRPRRQKEDPKGQVRAELFDEKGKILLKYKLSTKYYLVDNSKIPKLAVRGEIPFPSNTSTIKFYRDDVELYELPVPKGKPNVNITWNPPKIVKGKQTITWKGTHSIKDQPIQYFLRYTHDNGKTWQRVGWRTIETKHEIDFDQLPGGKTCKIAIVATDGVNTVIEESSAFTVPVKPCQAFILEPKDGAEFHTDQTIVFRGQGYFLEERIAETKDLVWQSSLDNKLGSGMLLEVPKLTSGTHEILLIAGKGDRAGKAMIKIKIKK